MTKNRIIIVLLGMLIMVVLGVKIESEAAVAQTMQPRAYLPIITKGGPVPFGDVHDGIATYYDATGEGNCAFSATPDDLMVAAINSVEYDNAKWCGAYVRVDGKKGSIIVRIVDQCGDCFDAGHLDLSKEAFALIDDIPLGRVPITWQFVSPPLDEPISYYFTLSSHESWLSVQVRNHRNPIAKFEYLDSNGKFVAATREEWNQFELNGLGTGPFTFRVTDSFGNVLQDSGIFLTPGSATSGSGQFPPP